MHGPLNVIFEHLVLSSIWLESSEDATRFYGQVAVDRPKSILCPFSNYSRRTCPWASIGQVPCASHWSQCPPAYNTRIISTYSFQTWRWRQNIASKCQQNSPLTGVADRSLALPTSRFAVACVLPGRAKDLSASLYTRFQHLNRRLASTLHHHDSLQSVKFYDSSNTVSNIKLYHTNSCTFTYNYVLVF
jgi:hypothetical protein